MRASGGQWCPRLLLVCLLVTVLAVGSVIAGSPALLDLFMCQRVLLVLEAASALLVPWSPLALACLPSKSSTLTGASQPYLPAGLFYKKGRERSRILRILLNTPSARITRLGRGKPGALFFAVLWALLQVTPLHLPDSKAHAGTSHYILRPVILTNLLFFTGFWSRKRVHCLNIFPGLKRSLFFN